MRIHAPTTVYGKLHSEQVLMSSCYCKLPMSCQAKCFPSQSTIHGRDPRKWWWPMLYALGVLGWFTTYHYIHHLTLSGRKIIAGLQVGIQMNEQLSQRTGMINSLIWSLWHYSEWRFKNYFFWPRLNRHNFWSVKMCNIKARRHLSNILNEMSPS